MGGHFDIDQLNENLSRLTDLQNEPNFWDDIASATKISKEIQDLKKIITIYNDLYNDINDLNELIDLVNETEFNSYIDDIKNRISNFEINIYLNNEIDKSNVFLEIHPGAGGTESCDWANMLLRMYQRFCEINDYKYEEISINKGEEAGIKSALIKISGNYSYGYLKNENGVHRLVRISPFDANKRRHTSFASVSVIPELDESVDIEIKESDLKIDVYHSSGAGGQSVNTSNSAVRITHLPSKLVVTCQNERSQQKNKDMALKILKNKLYNLELEKKKEENAKYKQVDTEINFGSQIRSYFLEPYKLVKDNRTDFTSSDPEKILDGNIINMLEFNLKNIRKD